MRVCALLGVLLILPAAAGARQANVSPRSPGILTGLFRNGRMTLLPSVALVPEATEAAFDGRLTWEPDRRGLPSMVRIGAFGRTASRRSWRGAGVDGEWTVSPGAFRLWLGFDATVGTGNGPNAAFVARAGGRLGGVRLELRSAWWNRSILLTDTLPGSARQGQTARPSRHTEAELSASHRVGRVSFEGLAGRRFESASRQRDWAMVTLAGRVARGIEILVSGGARPQRPDRGERPGRFLLAGLRITPGPARSRKLSTPAPSREPAVAVVRNNDTQWTLTFRLPASDMVELTGDLTQWRAVSLARKGQTWRLTVTAPPGVYHVAMRIDGGPWIVPPGLPRVPDGFSGVVGLLELR